MRDHCSQLLTCMMQHVRLTLSSNRAFNSAVATTKYWPCSMRADHRTETARPAMRRSKHQIHQWAPHDSKNDGSNSGATTSSFVSTWSSGPAGATNAKRQSQLVLCAVHELAVEFHVASHIRPDPMRRSLRSTSSETLQEQSSSLNCAQYWGEFLPKLATSRTTRSIALQVDGKVRKSTLLYT
ncbi:uncharacterized protein K489DRAFT_23666 [Dissoconium aciculare CBS 342.82]|uniref:Uncharacterized protein n=1 Tax=Dissoconium aciculare CBS 342.82 TaxID=1314786 RepID=A0A6J3MIX7_9PEZI|nr:uncharacterized protein K489DRAFT_23666 [Dissoconium aciculare CBS 342.82]KAF1827669.1 hypothetical protein K489DRAFT_23666 [Dissoconium aciculare CBS 342.82]